MKKLYFIALCDDEAKELDQIENLLAIYQDKKQILEYKTERFESAEALLKRVIEEKYTPDLLVLDIFMSGKSGMEAEEEIRKSGCVMPIVFLTASTGYALKAYGVDAIQYLVKPLDKERFFHVMDFVFGHIQKMKEEHVIIKSAGAIRQINPDNIVYCESQKNYQVLYLTTEEYKVRMTTASLWGILERFPQFGRCSRSYILNMNHIVSVEREKVVMDNGSVIYISRNKVAEFKKEYFSYYFD